MDIYDKVELYSKFIKGSAESALDIIDAAEKEGVKDLIESLIAQGFSKNKIINLSSKKGKGRKPEIIFNPLAEHITNDDLEDNNGFDDAIFGVCNSFENSAESKRIKVTPKKLKLVLKMPEITTESVKGVLFVGKAQARRYIKAAKLVIALNQNKLATT